MIRALALALLAAGPAPADADAPRSRLVGYLASSSFAPPRSFDLARFDPAALTDINYAFAAIDPDGRLVPDDRAALGPRGTFARLRDFKRAHPSIRTFISVGGWGGSARFSDVALTDASRARFAKSCIDFLAEHGFDGVDIDWEFPVEGGLPGNARRPEDRANFTRLLAAIRATIVARSKADGRPYSLSIAAPATAWGLRSIDLKPVVDQLDWVNLMTYDFAGGWSRHADFHAPLRPSGVPGGLDVVGAVRLYLAAGIPREKIVVGVPFYGRGWVVAETKRGGIGSPPAPKPPRGLAPGFEVTYRALFARFPLAKRLRDEAAQAPYLFDPARSIFLGYDDAESLRAKASFIARERLGGAMIWELSQDDDAGTLLHALTPTTP